jgi:hypothetical protein
MTASAFYIAASPITTPNQHAAAVHRALPGSVALARKDAKSGAWRETAVPVADLPDVLPAVAGESNVYLSTQRFHGWRRITQLASCGALAVDLDYYRRPELRGLDPERVLETAMIALEEARIPAPSLAIASGRGLYLLWFHSPVPRAALSRWNACQRVLYEVLKPLGADRAALDAARVLRLVGTRHAGTGATVRALQGGDPGEVWEFDVLADEVLPHGRAELHDLRVQRAARAARRPSKSLWAPPQGFTRATLWEARLTDLQRLRELRWFGDPMPDYRDRWLFIAGVAMGWFCEPAVMQRELYALAREAGGWTEGKARSKMQAVFRTVRAATRGERVEWGSPGVQVDPRYRMKNATILDWLEITPGEEREMRTIISDDERRRRWRERDEARRREAGAVPREEYLGSAAARRERVLKLRQDEGMSLRRIAEITGIALSEVHRFSASFSAQKPTTQNPIDKPCSESLPLYGGVAAPQGLPKGLEAAPPPALPPAPDAPEEWRAHPLACECAACLYPSPRYAGCGG